MPRHRRVSNIRRGIRVMITYMVGKLIFIFVAAFIAGITGFLD